MVNSEVHPHPEHSGNPRAEWEGLNWSGSESRHTISLMYIYPSHHTLRRQYQRSTNIRPECEGGGYLLVHNLLGSWGVAPYLSAKRNTFDVGVLCTMLVPAKSNALLVCFQMFEHLASPINEKLYLSLSLDLRKHTKGKQDFWGRLMPGMFPRCAHSTTQATMNIWQHMH